MSKYFDVGTDPMLYDCPCGKCDHEGPSETLLAQLDEARDFAGVPFVVTSGPRCADHNDAIGGSLNSEHIDGNAADIRATDSRARFAILRGAVIAGITRIGVGKDFIHLGVSEMHDEDCCWVYKG